MRIKHNDLVWYFIRPHDQLPASYLKSCKKFFDSLGAQAPKASSHKLIQKNLHKPGTRVKNRFNRKI